jgi:hypothetical protein
VTKAQPWIGNSDQKATKDIIHEHFKTVIGMWNPRSQYGIANFEELDLHGRGVPFTEEEVKKDIDQMSGDKAHGLDDYMGALFIKC